MDAQGLAAALRDADEDQLVRLVADWMARAGRADDLDLHVAPLLTGRRHIDALVAAAAAQVARGRGEVTPAWTVGVERTTEVFWYPGPAALFPNALVHAPGEFAIRGVFIESDSLVSV